MLYEVITSLVAIIDAIDPNNTEPIIAAKINIGIVTKEKSTDSKNTGYPISAIKAALISPIIPMRNNFV